MTNSKVNATFQEITDVIRAHQRFVVLSHMRPDGDAIGSQVAMAEVLCQLGKDVTVWNEDEVPEKFHFLEGTEQIKTPPIDPLESQDFDVAIVLDVAAHKRAGTPLNAIRNVKFWINIDHHITNDRYGDLAYVDSDAPATGQILYELFQSMELSVSKVVADNLFVAISTDTGSFQYPGTTARTFEIGAALIKQGVNVGAISQHIYDSYPYRRIELLRALLNTLELCFDGKLACVFLTQETVKKIHVKPEDSEGLIDHVRAIQGVVVAVFFEELPDGNIRLSMRSKDERIDVSKVCGYFNGGGHCLAAGARMSGTLAELHDQVKARFAPLLSSTV